VGGGGGVEGGLGGGWPCVAWDGDLAWDGERSTTATSTLRHYLLLRTAYYVLLTAYHSASTSRHTAPDEGGSPATDDRWRCELR